MLLGTSHIYNFVNTNHLKINESTLNKLQKMMNDSKEEWRAMKVIVLGHGRIGKTSLITRLHEIFNQHENKVLNLDKIINNK